MNKKGPIGIFDSGIGGVTVLKEIKKILPDENYLYYSDSKNNPYGDKENKEILNICDSVVQFLLNNNCKMIIIACNTASARAVNFLRDKYKEIPIIAIEPAYKMVYDFAYDKPTLVMATKGTIESEKFNLLYNKYNNNKTYLLPCIGLAEIIEQDKKEEIKKYLMEKIGKYRGAVKNVVLGCTHYPLIKKEIQEILGDIEFFDGSKRLAVHVKKVLERENLIEKKEGKIVFVDSQKSEEKKDRFFKILKNIQ